jgi:hypothetical protein
MQSTRGNTKLLQHREPGLNGVCPGQGDDEGSCSDWVRKAQNGMQITWEIFTLRMRTGHRLTASYGQGLVVWELVR